MNALEELERILLNEAKVEGKCESLIRLNSLAEKVTTAMNGETVSGSTDPDKMGNNLVKKEKLKNELAMVQDEYERHRDFMSGIVDRLNNTAYIKILYGLYFNGKELKEVANEIGYSYRHTQDLRDVAIQAVQKILDGIESPHTIS